MYALSNLSIPFQRWRRKLGAKIFTCTTLVVGADILFYRQQQGWTLGLFALGVLLAVVLHQPHLQKSKQGKLLIAASLGLALSLIEQPTTLAINMFALTIFWLAISPKMESVDARHMLRFIIRYSFFTSVTRIYRDGIIFVYVRKRARQLRGSQHGWLLLWLMPVLCTVGFAALFAQANPIVAHWVDLIDINFPKISPGRMALWLFTATGCWALLRPRLRIRLHRSPSQWSQQQLTTVDFSLIKLLFNEHSSVLSLMLFNGLFLVQNLMDIAFLWSGAGLPEGMSHAEYAHRGAYPLMITALLAAFFILVAFKAEIMPSKQVRALIYAWVGQNVFLVFSSILRLKGYVDEYSLTYLRVAAWVWMMLIAVGLLLIIARIYLHRSNCWLVNRNAIIAYLTLYVCCFINFGGMIAHYNLAKFENPALERRAPDLWYIENEIGEEAIPALIHAERTTQDSITRDNICTLRQKIFSKMNISDWHAWTFRKHRIMQLPFYYCEYVMKP